uniref:COesterase domain-containing protein n=1 Tax=Rhabditophanes sp. KR3021 TaxID=114890 RepID=A0AC35TNQ4_9BILA
MKVVGNCLLLLILLAFVSKISHGQKLEKSRSVWVEQGLIRGQIYKFAGKQIQIFRGIPYAEPPVGKLRFKKPIRKGRWDREYSAIEYGAPCIQFMDFHKSDKFASENMKKESEDCLYLNIFSPFNNDDESELHNIVVWIHGGSNHAGSADTGIDIETVAKNIVFQGVTLVTINYRLGPLGFMSINYGDHVEGNFGIYDMKLALEWIQANIKPFNGNPMKVTIMGESAGAAAVSALALSPLATNLVHSAITLSGSVLAHWALHRSGPSNYDINNIADYMKCTKLMSQQDITEFLKTESQDARDKGFKNCNLQEVIPSCLTSEVELTAIELVECFQKEVFFNGSVFRKAIANELGVARMIVDGELITDNTLNYVTQNARVPLLAGVAKREWAHKKGDWYQLGALENLTHDFVEDRVRKTIDETYKLGLTHKLHNSTLYLLANTTMFKYMDGIDFNYTTDNIVKKLQDIESDIDFVAPCQAEIDGYANKGVDVFAYSFDYMPDGDIYEEDFKYYSFFNGDQPVRVIRKYKTNNSYPLEAYHGLDHAFIFSQGYSANFQIDPFSKKDKFMASHLTQMITNFVKTGNPSTERFKWNKYTPVSKQHASLKIPMKMMKGEIHWPSPSFWNNEAKLLSNYIVNVPILTDDHSSALSNEERIQLNAYRRAWLALWVLVIAIGALLWTWIVCLVIQKRRPSSSSRPYDNIIINH